MTREFVLMIPRKFTDELAHRLSGTAFKLYFVLEGYRDCTTGDCWPSLETMAKKMNASVQTARRALKELVEAGFVIRTPRASEASILKLPRRTIVIDSGWFRVEGDTQNETPPKTVAEPPIRSDAERLSDLIPNHIPGTDPSYHPPEETARPNTETKNGTDQPSVDRAAFKKKPKHKTKQHPFAKPLLDVWYRDWHTRTGTKPDVKVQTVLASDRVARLCQADTLEAATKILRDVLSEAWSKSVWPFNERSPRLELVAAHWDDLRVKTVKIQKPPSPEFLAIIAKAERERAEKAAAIANAG